VGGSPPMLLGRLWLLLFLRFLLWWGEAAAFPGVGGVVLEEELFLVEFETYFGFFIAFDEGDVSTGAENASGLALSGIRAWAREREALGIDGIEVDKAGSAGHLGDAGLFGRRPGRWRS
jgi:hypothetical protein